jgi:prevent-host-death family protein
MSDRTISAADANRHFSSLLREVAAGHAYAVVFRGRPVARVLPIDADESMRESARQRLLARLDAQPVSGEPRSWTRDDASL